jgi:hypothetical protein
MILYGVCIIGKNGVEEIEYWIKWFWKALFAKSADAVRQMNDALKIFSNKYIYKEDCTLQSFFLRLINK